MWTNTGEVGVGEGCGGREGGGGGGGGGGEERWVRGALFVFIWSVLPGHENPGKHI